MQKLEEKTMNVLTEIEKLRGEVKQLKHENFALRSEKENKSNNIFNTLELK